MRYGVFDQSEQPGGVPLGELYESRLRLAVRAEDLGFWGYHKSEHHLSPLDHAPSIGMFLAALSQRTTRLRLCSLVHILPFHHPLRLYEEICTLDHLSGGRTEVGFGKGISAPEHALWGLAPDEAAARTDETLMLLLAAFASAAESRTLTFDGEFFTYTDVPLEIAPLQQPYPPLWRPGTLDTAASMGVSTVAAGPTAVVHDALARYQDLVQPGIGGGHAPTVGVVRKVIIAPTDDEADEIGRRAWARYTHNLGLLFRRFDAPIPNDPTVGGDYDRAKELNVVVAGSPATVRAHYDELRSNDLVEYLMVAFAFGDLTHDQVLRSMELFAEHIMCD